MLFRSQMSQDFDFDDFDEDDDDDDETSSTCSEQLGARPSATNSKRQKTSNAAGSDKACGKKRVRARGWICDRLWNFNGTLPVEGQDVDAQIRSFFTALRSYFPITKPACSFQVHYIAQRVILRFRPDKRRTFMLQASLGPCQAFALSERGNLASRFEIADRDALGPATATSTRSE